MKEIDIVNNRTVFFHQFSTETNWAKSLPESNWLLLAIVSDERKTVLDEIACKVLDRNVCYAVCAGRHGEKLHDYIDENILFRNVDIEFEHHLPIEIMTTWHDSVDDALWFSIFAANHETDNIKTIVCLDVVHTPSIEHLLFSSISKMKAGWIPD